MIITLDGQSGTGKSTLAKRVAQSLGFNCFNTGMIYRAVAYYFLTKNVTPEDIDQIEALLPKMQIEICFNNNEQHVIISGLDCTPFVSIIEVQQTVSVFSQIPSIREKVTAIQRAFAAENNVVVEGRDIGTHVFPNADYKFFVTCDIKVRAQRRLADLQKSGQNISLDDVIQSLKTRDMLDTTRVISPLKRADDAIDIDTSNFTIEQSVNQILSYIKV